MLLAAPLAAPKPLAATTPSIMDLSAVAGLLRSPRNDDANTAAVYISRDKDLWMKFPRWREAPPYVARVLPIPPTMTAAEAVGRHFAYAYSCVTTARHCAMECLHESFDNGRSAPHPCHWCGCYAYSWCEHCHERAPTKAAHMLCDFCDRHIRICKLCRLEQQLAHPNGLPSQHNLAMSSYGNTWHCANCARQSEGLQMCQGCKVIRYCNSECQSMHWPAHKHVCKVLKQQLPMAFVYPWHLRRAQQVCRRCPSLLPPIITRSDLDVNGSVRQP